MNTRIKESELIRSEYESDTSDNDYRAWSYERKIHRAIKKEKFESDVFPVLKEKYKIIGGGTKYTIETMTKTGSVDFYPKSGSLFFRDSGKWIKSYGLNWIRKHLL